VTFTRLGDEFPAIAVGLSDAAWRTHVEGLIWSVNRGLDLLIPKRDVIRFAETSAEIDDVMAELLDKGWWLEMPDAYDIGVVEQDRTRQWQYTADQRLAKRAKDRERQSAWRARAASETDEITSKVTPVLSALPNPTLPKTASVTNALTNAVTNAVTEQEDPWTA
jgi:hypothetical protein